MGNSPNDFDFDNRGNRDEPDDYDDGPRRRQRGRFRCPFCGSNEPPMMKQKISVAGWIVMVVLIIFCLPLFWIGLLIKEDYRVCYDCGTNLQ